MKKINTSLLLVLAFLLGTVAGIMVSYTVFKIIQTGSTSMVGQIPLDATSFKDDGITVDELDYYNGMNITGSEAKTIINEIKGRDVAILVATKDWNLVGNNSGDTYSGNTKLEDLKTIEVSNTEEETTYKVFINYNALLKDNKIDFNKEQLVYVGDSGLQINVNETIINDDMGDIFSEESTCYIKASSKYSCWAVVDHNGALIGLVLEEL